MPDVAPVTAVEFAALPDIKIILRQKALAIAVSGGPDSMALAWLMTRAIQSLKPAQRPVLHALTVDHALRPQAAAEARQVGLWLKDWSGLTHKILTLKKNKNSGGRIMEAARQGRYDALAAYCRKHDVGMLLTAHHLDDQAETFLFRLAKGSGTDGLAAMRPQQKYNDHLVIVRPLLTLEKARLVVTCRANKIPFVEDPTNLNMAFARNRLRQAQDALAQEGLTAKRLGVTATRLRRASEALDHYAAQALEAALREKTKNSVVLDFPSLSMTPMEIRFRVLLNVMTMLRREESASEGYGPRRERLETLTQDLFGTEPFRKRTLGGFIFAHDRKKGLITVRREGAE